MKIVRMRRRKKKEKRRRKRNEEEREVFASLSFFLAAHGRLAVVDKTLVGSWRPAAVPSPPQEGSKREYACLSIT